jgi:hypothetical protein
LRACKIIDGYFRQLERLVRLATVRFANVIQT